MGTSHEGVDAYRRCVSSKRFNDWVRTDYGGRHSVRKTSTGNISATLPVGGADYRIAAMAGS
jgi:hypothetical protein